MRAFAAQCILDLLGVIYYIYCLLQFEVFYYGLMDEIMFPWVSEKSKFQSIINLISTRQLKKKNS